jgi:hypothetical protein
METAVETNQEKLKIMDLVENPEVTGCNGRAGNP